LGVGKEARKINLLYWDKVCSDRSLASVTKTIEVVKISFPQGLF